MPRIRSIKPDFFISPTIAALSLRARLTFIGMWTYVDDEGRGFDDARLIVAALWPLDDEVGHEEVAEVLDELDRHGLIERWRDEELGRDVLRVRSFSEHQRVNRPTPSKIPPAPSETAETTGRLSPPEPLTDSSVSPHARKRKRKGSGTGNGEGEAEALSRAAAALVVNKPEEAERQVLALIDKHGIDAVRISLEQVDGRCFEWKSDLAAELKARLPHKESGELLANAEQLGASWADTASHLRTDDDVHAEARQVYGDNHDAVLAVVRGWLGRTAELTEVTAS